jgi:hypothetical protein
MSSGRQRTSGSDLCPLSRLRDHRGSCLAGGQRFEERQVLASKGAQAEEEPAPQAGTEKESPNDAQAEGGPGTEEGSSKDAAKEDKGDKTEKEKPNEKKLITVPTGTSMMVKTGSEISSKDKAGRNFSAALEANLLSGDVVVAKAGTQVYGQVIKSKKIGRGIVVQYTDLVLGLTNINIEGTMYPIQTGSYSESSTGVILQRRSITIPAGSLLEFELTQPLTVKK